MHGKNHFQMQILKRNTILEYNNTNLYFPSSEKFISSYTGRREWLLHLSVQYMSVSLF